MLRRHAFALTFAAICGPGALPALAQDRPALVFAAASLKNALDEVGAAYTGRTGKPVVASYAASPALARQIEQAAPADLFISADLDWMDYLEERKLIQPATRVNLLGNRVVLVATRGQSQPVTIEPGFGLAGMLGDQRLAMADPNAVPAGKYGRAALEELGVWGAVESKLAPAENVRAALALVARGEAPLGIVYRTDAAIEPGVEIVGTFPETTHPPIIYPLAVLAGSTNPDAAAFAAFLRSGEARAVFEKNGFAPIAPPAGS